jgi:hypothetical protein
MQITGTMIGAAGDYTISAVVQRDDDGRYRALARAFDHPDPEKTLPSGTVPRHVFTAEGASPEVASKALERALAELLGPLNWVRWRYGDRQQAEQK